MDGFLSSLHGMKAKGHMLIGCFPLYPPLELLHSFGLTPVVLWNLEPGPAGLALSDRHLQPYACRVARCLTEFVLSHEYGLMDALFMYNACDTLRNLPEIIDGALREQGKHLPIFRLHIPAVSLHQEGAARYMEARMEGLITDLAGFTGRGFSEQAFLESIRLYSRQRALSMNLEARAAEGGMSFADCSEALMAAHRLPVEDHIGLLEKLLEGADGDPGNDPKSPAPLSSACSSLHKRHAVMLSGILPPTRDLIECMESVSLVIAANDIAAQKRSYASCAAATPDPVAYYEDFYRNHHPCPTILPSSDLRLEIIREAVRQNDIQGFIFIGEKFCEYEYFEFPYIEGMLKEMGVRSLFLETGTDGTKDPDSYKTRIETFAQLLDASSAQRRHS